MTVAVDVKVDKLLGLLARMQSLVSQCFFQSVTLQSAHPHPTHLLGATGCVTTLATRQGCCLRTAAGLPLLLLVLLLVCLPLLLLAVAALLLRGRPSRMSTSMGACQVWGKGEDVSRIIHPHPNAPWSRDQPKCDSSVLGHWHHVTLLVQTDCMDVCVQARGLALTLHAA
jgi:hypothetical protein